MSFALARTHELVTLNPRSRENVMRAALELLTCKPFVKIRPPWLRNPLTGRNLEIDAWCEELKLACEFQGYQHTVFPNRFHKTFDQFLAQQQRDKFKAQTLASLGIRLLEVPHTVCVEEIPSFLSERLASLNLLWPRTPGTVLSDVPEEPESDAIGRLHRTPVFVDMSRCAPAPHPLPRLDPMHAPRWPPFDRSDCCKLTTAAAVPGVAVP